MRRPFLFLILALALLLAACGGGKPASVQVVENFLNALVTKNADQLSALSCGDYEQSALMLMDSFEAVESQLESLACEEAASGTVKCTGKIITSYQGEKTELDLSRFTFTVVQEGGDWRVCDFR